MSRWFVEWLLTKLGIALVVRTYRPFWKSRPSTGLVVATIAVAAIALVLPYSPLAISFGLVRLAPRWIALLIGITTAYLAASELPKWIWWRRRASSRDALRGAPAPTDSNRSAL